MARVALGGSLRNSVQVCKGAAVEQPGRHTISFVPRGILTDVRTATIPSQAVDTSLPPAELIAVSVKRSSRAHMFHFYSLLCEIASVPHKAPIVWISVDRLAVLSGVPAKKGKEMETAATGRTHILVVVDRPRSPRVIRCEGTGATNTHLMWVNESLLSVRAPNSSLSIRVLGNSLRGFPGP
jgi:hypothetical protein